MIRFSAFGVPVEIQPWFWLTTALFGGITHASGREALLGVVVFMVIAAISVLVHEFGHALTGRRLGGGSAQIVLWAMGGLAYNRGGRFTRSQRFWMIFMGPGAGFLLLLLVLGVLAVFVGLEGSLWMASNAAFGKSLFMPSLEAAQRTYEFIGENQPRWDVIQNFVWINFWWGVINLLPVLPLDGGQIADLWVRPQPRMYLISAITAAVVAVYGFSAQRLFLGLMFGFLAYRSFQDYQSCRWR